jgi:hypothetical protein
MAVGAPRRAVIDLVARATCRVALAGAVAGVTGAVPAAASLDHLVSGLQPLDAWAPATAAAIVLGSAVLAIWAPVVRAVRIPLGRALAD